jgi:hypothetical protein
MSEAQFAIVSLRAYLSNDNWPQKDKSVTNVVVHPLLF